MPFKIAALVGSLRAESFNRRLAHALVRLPAAQEHDYLYPGIGDLPLYNQDDDTNQAPQVLRLRDEIRAADGVLFVTPEYNRSVPGVLKNAIDHASRPFGESAWKDKPAGVIGTSPSPVGTAAAQHHLRAICHALGMPVMGQPEGYIQWNEDLVTDQGTIGEGSHDFLDGWMKAFLAHVARHADEGWREPGAHL